MVVAIHAHSLTAYTILACGLPDLRQDTSSDALAQPGADSGARHILLST